MNYIPEASVQLTDVISYHGDKLSSSFIEISSYFLKDIILFFNSIQNPKIPCRIFPLKQQLQGEISAMVTKQNENRREMFLPYPNNTPKLIRTFSHEFCHYTINHKAKEQGEAFAPFEEILCELSALFHLCKTIKTSGKNNYPLLQKEIKAYIYNIYI